MGTRLRKAAAALALGLVSAGSSTLAAPAADASTYGWVYISAPTWLGNCNWGSNGSVTGLLVSVGNTWSTTSWYRGDDLVYARVRLGESQQVSYTAYCNKWPGSYQPGVAQMIRPTRNNQTVWVGPAGVRYN